MVEALNAVKDEKGVPITKSKLIHSITFKKDEVTVKINLTKDFRKLKVMLTSHLEKQLEWATKVTVSIAP